MSNRLFAMLADLFHACGLKRAMQSIELKAFSSDDSSNRLGIIAKMLGSYGCGKLRSLVSDTEFVKMLKELVRHIEGLGEERFERAIDKYIVDKFIKKNYDTRILYLYSVIRSAYFADLVSRGTSSGLSIIIAEVIRKKENIVASRIPRDMYIASRLISNVIGYIASRVISNMASPWQLLRPLSMQLIDYLKAIGIERVHVLDLYSPPGALTLIVPKGLDEVNAIVNHIRDYAKEYWRNIVSTYSTALRECLHSLSSNTEPGVIVNDSFAEKVSLDELIAKVSENPPYSLIATYVSFSGEEVTRLFMEGASPEHIAIVKSLGYKLDPENPWSVMLSLAEALHSSYAMNKYYWTYSELTHRLYEGAARRVRGRSILCTNCYSEPFIVANSNEYSVVIDCGENYKLVLRPRERLCIFHLLARLMEGVQVGR
jgi:hypothetical protein